MKPSDLHIPKKATRIIVIKPRLEEWIIKNAQAVKINPKDFFLPTTGKELHKVINSHLDHFEKMLEEMKKKKSPALIHLKKLIDRKYV